MYVKSEVFNLLLELIENDDAVALRFFLKWEKDRRYYLQHRTSDGLTLLHHACLSGKRKVVHCLVDCGADIEAKSSVGWTALHAAALSGSYDVVSYLVCSCASNPLARDDMGCLPQDLTLESRITWMLKEKLKELTAAATAETSRNQRFAQVTAQQRRNTFPETVTRKSNRTDILRVQSESSISRKVRFQDPKHQLEETKSLPGDIRQGMTEKPVDKLRGEQVESSKAKRDSGIFEDINCGTELAINEQMGLDTNYD